MIVFISLNFNKSEQDTNPKRIAYMFKSAVNVCTAGYSFDISCSSDIFRSLHPVLSHSHIFLILKFVVVYTPNKIALL